MSSTDSYGVGDDRFIRRGSDYTPDTSFEKRSKGVPAVEPYDGEALESRLRRAAYESAAKRKKREEAEDPFGSTVRDRRTLARVQDWVEGARQEQVSRIAIRGDQRNGTQASLIVELS